MTQRIPASWKLLAELAAPADGCFLLYDSGVEPFEGSPGVLYWLVWAVQLSSDETEVGSGWALWTDAHPEQFSQIHPAPLRSNSLPDGSMRAFLGPLRVGEDIWIPVPSLLKIAALVDPQVTYVEATSEQDELYWLGVRLRNLQSAKAGLADLRARLKHPNRSLEVQESEDEVLLLSEKIKSSFGLSDDELTLLLKFAAQEPLGNFDAAALRSHLETVRAVTA